MEGQQNGKCTSFQLLPSTLAAVTNVANIA